MMNLIRKVRINNFTYLFLCLCFLCGYIKNICIIFFICIVHEFGHVIFIKLFKYEITCIELFPFGGFTTINKRINTSINKDIIISIRSRISNYFVDVDLKTINLTHEYNNVKSYNISDNVEIVEDKINIIEINVEKEEVINKHFSKENISIIDNITKNNMDLGTYLHELFESIDLKNPDYTDLNESDINYVNKLLSNDIMKNVNNAKIYKEYEFIYEESNEKYHGIIDLFT